MSSDTSSLRPWHRPRSGSRSSSSTPSSLSPSSAGNSLPVTPLDAVFPHLQPCIPARTYSAEDYRTQNSSSDHQWTQPEEPYPQNNDDYEATYPHRPRTQTVTPASVLRDRDPDQKMRIPFPGSNRDSSSSTDSPPSYSDSSTLYDEEHGGIPARHPLRTRGNSSKGSSFLLLGDADDRDPYTSKRPHRPDSTSTYSSTSTFSSTSTYSSSSSSPPRTSSLSLRIKPKKSHRSALTLFKSLASSPQPQPLPDPPEEWEDIEVDWAAIRRSELEQRSVVLEQTYEEDRRAAIAETEVQAQADADAKALADAEAKVQAEATVESNNEEAPTEDEQTRTEADQAQVEEEDVQAPVDAQAQAEHIPTPTDDTPAPAELAQAQNEACGTEAPKTGSIRPKSWSKTPEGLEIQRLRQDEEARRFTFKDRIWTSRSYVSPHPSHIVPYPLAYNAVDLQTDRHAHDLVKQLLNGRPSIHDEVSQRPPALVLDLGCGDGTWIFEAAQCWRTTRFYGLDLHALHPDLAGAENVRFTYWNFVVDRLPYLDEKFDMVRMANLKWAIPEDKWDFVLEEVHRVLRRGGWVEIIDDDFLLGTSPHSANTLSPSQHTASHTLQTQFARMLAARNLPLNTGSEFMRARLAPWFAAPREDDYAVALSKARPVSVEMHGQPPVQVLLPVEGVSQKAAKLMGFGYEGHAHEKHLSVGSAASSTRSRSGSTSSSASSGPWHTSRDDLGLEKPDYPDQDEAGSVKELAKQPLYQPLGLDVHPGRFIPFSPAELNAHAVRNMQSILAAKEAIRTHELQKAPELRALEVRSDLLPEERQRFEELRGEWSARQQAFDDMFWDFESAMSTRLGLPQRCFDMDEDEELPKATAGTRPQPHRSSSGMGKFHRGSDANMPSPTASTFSVGAGSNVPVRLVRVYSGWKY